MTGNPIALTRALRTIERASKPDFGPLTPLYVLGEIDSDWSQPRSTHPPTDERVERLRDQAAESQTVRVR